MGNRILEPWGGILELSVVWILSVRPSLSEASSLALGHSAGVGTACTLLLSLSSLCDPDGLPSCLEGQTLKMLLGSLVGG